MPSNTGLQVLENPSTPSGVLKRITTTAAIYTAQARKPLNTLRGIETIGTLAVACDTFQHVLENPSTPSGVLKPSQRQYSPGSQPLLEPQSLENPSTPSGVLKPLLNYLKQKYTLQKLENPSTPSGVLKQCVTITCRSRSMSLGLENPSTPSGVLKRSIRSTTRESKSSSSSDSKTPQHPPGY